MTNIVKLSSDVSLDKQEAGTNAWLKRMFESGAKRIQISHLKDLNLNPLTFLDLDSATSYEVILDEIDGWIATLTSPQRFCLGAYSDASDEPLAQRAIVVRPNPEFAGAADPRDLTTMATMAFHQAREGTRMHMLATQQNCDRLTEENVTLRDKVMELFDKIDDLFKAREELHNQKNVREMEKAQNEFTLEMKRTALKAFQTYLTAMASSSVSKSPSTSMKDLDVRDIVKLVETFSSEQSRLAMPVFRVLTNMLDTAQQKELASLIEGLNKSTN